MCSAMLSAIGADISSVGRSADSSSPEMPVYLCCIRPYRRSDRFTVRDLNVSAVMSTVTPFFMAALFRELLWEALVATLAVLFVVLHVPGDICLMLVPIFFISTYAAIWLSHWARSNTHIADLDNIPESYKSSGADGCNFFVAEVLEPVSGPLAAGRHFQLTFISEDEMRRYSDAHMGAAQRLRVIGTCGLRAERSRLGAVPAVETTHDGRLNRLCVAADYRRHGVGTQLLDAVIARAVSCGYQMLYAHTTECHDSAKSLLHDLGFSVLQYIHQPVLAAVTIGIYKFVKNIDPAKERSNCD